MNQQQIVDELKKRRAELTAELTKVDAMIAAAEGKSEMTLPMPFPLPDPTTLPYPNHGGLCACPQCMGHYQVTIGEPPTWTGTSIMITAKPSLDHALYTSTSSGHDMRQVKS